MITTPRAKEIYNLLVEDVEEILKFDGTSLRSRQVKALALAVARHLDALESLVDRREVE